MNGADVLSALHGRRGHTEAENHFLCLLDLWVEWMGKKDGRGRAPTRAAGFANMPTNYRTAEDDSDAYYETLRLKPALGFDACVESLYGHERVAIYKAQGFRATYDIRWMPYEQALTEGMGHLRKLVAKRC